MNLDAILAAFAQTLEQHKSLASQLLRSAQNVRESEKMLVKENQRLEKDLEESRKRESSASDRIRCMADDIDSLQKKLSMCRVELDAKIDEVRGLKIALRSQIEEEVTSRKSSPHGRGD